MTFPGPWITPIPTVEPATAIAYPESIASDGYLIRANSSTNVRTVGSITQERWLVWPFTKVAGATPSWTHPNAWRLVKGEFQQNLGLLNYDFEQNFRQLLANSPHPAIALMPPSAVGIEYLGWSPRPVLSAVTCTPQMESALLDQFLAGQLPTVPWSFEIRADVGLHATAFPAAPYYQYGFRSDIAIDPTLWPVVLTGTVDTANVVTLSAPNFTVALDATKALSVRIKVTSTSSDPAQANWRWIPTIKGMSFAVNATWPNYRYLFPSAGRWNSRQRQNSGGNAGGWPSRQRQHGGISGGWPERQRQARN